MKPKSETTEFILEFLGDIGSIIVACSDPRISRASIIGLSDEIFYKKNSKYSKHQYAKSLYNLSRRGYVSIENKNRNITLKLSGKGELFAMGAELNKIRLEKNKKWDKRWRVLIFDIKSNERTKRDALRRKLKYWNFYQLQKSVWVFPYIIEKEMEKIKKILDLSDDELIIITASKVQNEKALLKHFKVK
jgi:DNA-binding transcriptional regulator PaaX